MNHAEAFAALEAKIAERAARRKREVHVSVDVQLGWMDRLRILVGKPLHYRAAIDTGVELPEPGTTSVTYATTWVDVVFPFLRRAGQMAVESPR